MSKTNLFFLVRCWYAIYYFQIYFSWEPHGKIDLLWMMPLCGSRRLLMSGHWIIADMLWLNRLCCEYPLRLCVWFTCCGCVANQFIINIIIRTIGRKVQYFLWLCFIYLKICSGSVQSSSSVYMEDMLVQDLFLFNTDKKRGQITVE